MTPLGSPDKPKETLPNSEFPWPLQGNPLRKEAMLPKKLFDKAMEEKEDGDKLEAKALKDHLITVRRDGGVHDDTKEKTSK